MNGKIQKLLNRAEAQENSADDGKSSVSRAGREFSTQTEAENAFQKFKRKLFFVNGWEADTGVSAFQLFDEKGAEINSRPAQTGDFVRITMPGSGKHDWVKIAEVFEDSTEAVITVQPTFDPTETDKETKETTSHFFKSGATNNFCLQQASEKIFFYVIGLNEKANTDESGGLLESVRNLAVANLGWLGFQKIEWQTFCENFLKAEE